MRVHLLRLVPVALGLTVLLWFVPMLVTRATKADWLQTQGYYSTLRSEFVLLEAGPGIYRYYDEAGNRLTMREARMALPFLHARDVQKWGGFPLDVAGKTFSYAEAQRVKLIRVNPRKTVMPLATVHVLQESAPEASSFELPEDILLLDHDGVRFVNCADGSPNEAKGRLFTQAMRAAGVAFPLRVCGGNPSPYKDIDEGLVLVDAEGHAFQLRMRKGRPLCRRISARQIVGARQAYLSESRDNAIVGLLAADDGLYVIERGKGLRPLPVQYNPVYDAVSAAFTPMDASLSVRPLGPEPMQTGLLSALDADNQFIRSVTIASPVSLVERLDLQQKWISFLCPVTLTQFEPYLPDTRLQLHSPSHWGWAAAGILAASLLLAAVRQRQRQSLATFLPELLLTLVFGFPALLLLLIFGPPVRKSRNSGACCTVIKTVHTSC